MGFLPADGAFAGQFEADVIHRLLARRLAYRGFRGRSYEQYRDSVNRHYSGLAGRFLRSCSIVSLHEPLARVFFRSGAFPLTGCQRILDVGSGAGQLLTHLLKHADPECRITATDLSQKMLERTARRFPDPRVDYVSADLSQLPFEDASFDMATCGWVLEYLPDPEPGLKELARVVKPGGRILLQVTESTVFGAMSSRLWKCRTYERQELAAECERVGLTWERELWFTPVHRLLKLGGIIVDVRTMADQSAGPKV